MAKTTVDFGDSVERALSRYAQDRENIELDNLSIQEEISIKRSVPAGRLLPKLMPSTPVSSFQVTDYIREAKLRVNLVGSQSLILGNEIFSAVDDFWSTLDDVQAELKALDSDIQEEEIKVEDRFQQVHFNAFNRSIDTAARSKLPVLDPKTELPFLQDQRLRVMAETGLTLPVTKEERVFIKSIILLDEGTDVGDTAAPLIKTDPNNLLDPDLSFQYVIARKAFDETGRKYNYTASKCKLLVTLGHIQLINHLNLRPLSHSPIIVESIEYLNEVGELILIDAEMLQLDTNLNIILEPVRTNNLIVTLVQYAPVEQTEIFVGDVRKKNINKALSGAGWSTLLNNPGDYLKARVYDFSLESLTVTLFTYKQSGYFLSQKLNVESPLSFSLNIATETVKITGSQQGYGTAYFLPEDTVLYETYLKVKLFDGASKKHIESTVPVPTTKKLQTEMLVLSGGIGRATFVPDVLFESWNPKIKAILFAGKYAFVELVEAHGLVEGTVFEDPIEIFSGSELPDYNFSTESWEVLTSTMLVLNTETTYLPYLLDQNSTPLPKLTRALDAKPFKVYKEETELVLGADYEYSLDSGVTWLQEWASLRVLAALKSRTHAGSFRIKVLNPDYDSYYWCLYKRASVQWLHSNKLFLLKKNAVIVDKRVRQLKGSVQTMIVLRADSRIPYLSSLIHNYKLKVRQL